MKKILLIALMAPVMAWGQKINFELSAGGANMQKIGTGFASQFNIYGKIISVVNFGAGLNLAFYKDAPERPVYSAFPEIRIIPKLSDKVGFMFIGGVGKAINAHRTYITIGGGLKFDVKKNTGVVLQVRYIQHAKKEVETQNGIFASLGISL